MPKNDYCKQRLMYIKQYLEEKTDENHSVSTVEILQMLAAHGIKAERKAIYSDIAALKDCGMDIINLKGRNGGVKLLSRTFELTELKILVDAVQSSRFITLAKTKKLIRELEKFTSVYERDQLNRSVYVENRIKSENENIYYNTDSIHSAINGNSCISFKYYDIGPDKRRKYHNNGAPITVSPYGLQFDNEKYYLIAYESKSEKIKHYRVDKMDSVRILDIQREGGENFKDFDLAEYSKKTVKMFGGEIENVIMKCPGELSGQIMDKFGRKCIFHKGEDSEYSVEINVALSPTFYSWVFAFGGRIKIISPAKAAEEYKEQLKNALKSMD